LQVCSIFSIACRHSRAGLTKAMFVQERLGFSSDPAPM
jgi:hypothetical protein